MLEKAINDYFLWMKSKGYAQGSVSYYKWALKHFLSYIVEKEVTWETIFTLHTLNAFQKETGRMKLSTPIRGLSRFLFQHKRITQPINRQRAVLPEIAEAYLLYCERTRPVNPHQITRTRNLLCALNDYLENHKIPLPSLKIEAIDDFLVEYSGRFTPGVRKNVRSYLRGFLSYLYLERKILQRNLAPLVVGAPMFAETKPPRFLRPREVQRLFASLKLSSPKELRAGAMLRLAYTLGLRPKEISSITLDDISFKMGEITLRSRKSLNPIKLPMPEDTMKAIAAYIIGARPKNTSRALFLSLKAPYGAISSGLVCIDIGDCMAKANIDASAYWLRHTYAQNLMESGAGIYEIKEMLGHDTIETTKRYIRINTKLIREALFDETL